MKRSYLISLGIVLAITIWMLAGRLSPDARDPVATTARSTETAAMTVAVETKTARDIVRYIVAHGHVEPHRVVTVRAETAGRISALGAEEGERVRAGNVLATIADDDRTAQLKKAKARVTERRQAHERVKRLAKKGYQAESQFDETLAELTIAEAELDEIRIDIEKTAIRAPFDGTLELRDVEFGDYVEVSGEIATIVDNNPLIVAVRIAQHDIRRITLSDSVDVVFATGETATGTVSYIAPRAEQATRTFRIEIEVPNPQATIRSGMSAEARIPTGTVSAQFVSSALLSLDAGGAIGIKTVDDDNVVVFHPIDIVMSEKNGIWVSGLPEVARVIAVGHGFVSQGQLVRVSAENRDSGGEFAVPARDDAAKIVSRLNGDPVHSL
tara:strand:- start:3030 stop:4181 length:1152 start_codon:yes stop_codon:yes gene_type:complete